jgi:UDP:flavonoid glycosyltransferase YjiC (YdhE family)
MSLSDSSNMASLGADLLTDDGISPCLRRPMKRILFFGEAVSLAHAARPYLLAASLDKSQYDVHFAVADRYAIVPRGEGSLRLWPLHSIAPEAFLTALANGQPIYREDTLREYVIEDLAILDEVRPDLVIGDFRLSLSVSAPLRNIHYVAITNAHWSPYSCRTRFPFPEHPLGKLIGIPLASWLFNLVQPIAFKQHAAPLNRVRRSYGFEQFADLREAYTWADTTLYADVPELLPTKNLPAYHRYIGPLLWSPDVPKPNWWEQLAPAEVCVYVTLGSSGQVNALGAVLEGLARLPVTVLLASAGRPLRVNLPRNVHIAEYLPGTDAARRSAFVICNGGSATAYQALAVGTPVLGIPSNLDQHLTMAAITEFGAGTMIRSESATAELVAILGQRMLEDRRLKQSAVDVQAMFEACIATRNFSQLIKKILSAGSVESGASANNGRGGPT